MTLAGQLQDQCDAVVAATGRERDRLRRDLPDGLVPSLTGVGFGLQTLCDTVRDAPSRELVAVLHREVAAAVTDVRRILDDLFSTALAGTELAAALPRRIPPGMGMASMRAHAAALGGALEFSSSPVGTTVTHSLPLDGACRAAEPTLEATQ